MVTVASANERTDRITKAPQVVATVAQFETDRTVDCMQPKEGQLHWLCTMESCGFALDITCVSRLGTTSNDEITRLSILGREVDDKVVFRADQRIIEYKKLERK